MKKEKSQGILQKYKAPIFLPHRWLELSPLDHPWEARYSLHLERTSSQKPTC